MMEDQWEMRMALNVHEPIKDAGKVEIKKRSVCHQPNLSWRAK